MLLDSFSPDSPRTQTIADLFAKVQTQAAAAFVVVAGLVARLQPAGDRPDLRPAALYPAYLNPDDHLRILPLLGEQWGLDPKNGLQLRGLSMCLPRCYIYLTGILATIAHWYEKAPAGRPL